MTAWPQKPTPPWVVKYMLETEAYDLINDEAAMR